MQSSIVLPYPSFSYLAISMYSMHAMYHKKGIFMMQKKLMSLTQYWWPIPTHCTKSVATVYKVLVCEECDLELLKGTVGPQTSQGRSQ